MIGYKVRAFGYPRHPEPRLGESPARGIMPLKDGARLRMNDDRQSKRRRDRIDGDVVVRRPDPARREEIVVRRQERMDRIADPLRIVRHDAHLAQADALDVQPAGDLGDVAVLRSAREDLVADDDQGCRPDSVIARLVHPLPRLC